MLSLGYSLSQCLEMCLRLIVACACGAIIGFEREKKYKDAGLRTHIIVCCSAALLMIVSKYGFIDLYANGDFLYGTKGVDPARIAAQVISGVGFIGAGVIFHNKNNTKGLTTAAGLWAIAGIGLAVGAGMYEIGIAATLIIAIIQTIIFKTVTTLGVTTVVDIKITAVNSKKIREKINEYVKEHTTGVRDQSIAIEGDTITYRMTVKMGGDPTVDSINKFFKDEEEIKSVSFSVLS